MNRTNAQMLNFNIQMLRINEDGYYYPIINDEGERIEKPGSLSENLEMYFDRMQKLVTYSFTSREKIPIKNIQLLKSRVTQLMEDYSGGCVKLFFKSIFGTEQDKKTYRAYSALQSAIKSLEPSFIERISAFFKKLFLL